MQSAFSLSFSFHQQVISRLSLLARILLIPLMESGGTMSKPAILLAERNPELGRSLFSHLLCQGYDVIEAPTMSEVFRALRQRRSIDLFVLSASFDHPGDGVELAQLLHQSRCSARVIVLAEKEAHNWAEPARTASVAAYLEQPFSHDEVLACIHQVSERDQTDRWEVEPLSLILPHVSFP
jgi:DNA-binding response OmpR family regulator